MYYRLITLSIMMLLLTGVTPIAYSQQTPPGQQSPPAQQKMPDIEVSDKELEKFVNAVDKVKDLQENAQKKMVDAIEKEGLDANRFVQINNIDRNPEKDIKKEVSENELESFNKAKQKVSKMQQNMQNKQVKAIESEGIDVQRYVEIARAAQRDPELRSKIQEMQSQ